MLPYRPTIEPFANGVYNVAAALRIVPKDQSDPLGLGAGMTFSGAGTTLGGDGDNDRPSVFSTLAYVP